MNVNWDEFVNPIKTYNSLKATSRKLLDKAVNSFLLEQNRVHGCPTCLIAYFAGIGTDAQYRQGIKDGLFVWQSRKPKARQSLWLNLTPKGAILVSYLLGMKMANKTAK